jgi:hypothetical protein
MFQPAAQAQSWGKELWKISRPDTEYLFDRPTGYIIRHVSVGVEPTKAAARPDV